MPASLAASACGFRDEGREGEAESRVGCVGGFADLSRLREGEAARRAARECTVTWRFLTFAVLAIWAVWGVPME